MCQIMEGNFRFTSSNNPEYYAKGESIVIYPNGSDQWRLVWTPPNKPTIFSDPLSCENGVLRGTVTDQEEAHNIEISLEPGLLPKKIRAKVTHTSKSVHHLAGEWHAEEQGGGQGGS